MKQRTNTFFNRKAIDFRTSRVNDVLPDYFKEDYPNLIKFLDYYYDFMDSDGTHAFNSEIYELFRSKDIEATSLTLLDNIFKEIGLGTSQNYFSNPRQVAAFLAKFYRIKGSLYSAEGFFRAFFDEQPTISYPKENIFIVSESKIGTESQRFIINNDIYQIFSILIKSSRPVSQWKDLYKRFAHPAGWYFAGQVQIEGIGDLIDSAGMPLSVPDEGANLFSVGNSASFTPSPFTSISAIYPDGADADSDDERIDLNATIDIYDSATIATLDGMYDNIEDVIDLTSPTMDEDSDGSVKPIKLSNVFERMDKDNFDN
jgi:hypothetical protein